MKTPIALWAFIVLAVGLGATGRAAGLAAGDLAVVGYNADFIDGFTLVALADIPGNTTLFVTDRSFDQDLGSFAAISLSEATYAWTTPGVDVPAGTLVTYGHFGLLTAGVGSGSFVFGSSFQFGLAGDQVLVYCTPDDQATSSPTFICAFNNDVVTTPLTNTAGQWMDPRDRPNSVSRSHLPVPGVSEALVAGDGGTANGLVGEVDNAVYIGPTNAADKATWLGRISTPGNWITDNDTPLSIEPGGGFLPASFAVVDPPPATVVAVNRFTASPSDGSNVAWDVVFDLPVAGLTGTNLSLADVGDTLTGEAVVSVADQGGGAVWRVTADTGTGDGTLRLDVDNDGGLTPLLTNVPFTNGQTIVVDKSGPGISIGAPSTALTRGGPVTYTVTYTGATTVFLSNGDITLNRTGSATGTVEVTGSGTTTRTVALNGITGDGSLGISIAAGTASDGINPAAAAGPSATVAVDNTGPAVAIGPPSVGRTAWGPVSYTVTYTDAAFVSLDAGDVSLNPTGNASGSVVSVTGTGTATRTVTVSEIAGAGALGISVGAGTATDALGNPAAAAGPGATVVVDNPDPERRVLLCEDFEDDGNTNRYDLSRQFNVLSLNKIFDQTTDASHARDGSYVAFSDSGFFAAEDTDAFPEGDGNPVQTVIFTNVPVTGATNLAFYGLFAAGDEAPASYDPEDQLLVEVQIDGQPVQQLLQFESDSAVVGGRPLAADTDFNGVGDGTPLGLQFQPFSAPIPGIGSNLTLVLQVRANAGLNSMAFDLIKITADGGGVPEIAVHDGPLVSDMVITNTGEAAPFGVTSVPLGAIERTFNIDNTAGLGTLAISNVSFAAGNADDFSLAGGVPASVAGGASETITVRFEPADTGLRSTTLVIESDDADEGTYLITLIGEGNTTEPEIDVHDGPAITDPSIPSGDAAGDFGSAIVAGAVIDRTFNIDNTAGTFPLSVTGISLLGGDDGDFRVLGPVPASVPAGASDIVVVRFDPSVDGPRTTTLRIASNDSDQGIYDIGLTGTGTTGSSLLREDFETDGNPSRYTQSVQFFDPAEGIFSQTTNVTHPEDGAYTGFSNAGIFAAKDTDDLVSFHDEQTLTFTNNIAGQTGLVFNGLFAAGDEDPASYDTNDFVIVEAQVDAGAPQTLLQFESDSALFGNRPMAQDTDFDGVGDGTELGLAFQAFSAPIPGTGTNLTLTIRIRADAGTELVALDLLQVTGEPVVQADLGIEKVAPPHAIAGTLLTYSITVTNGGPSDAENVQVNDALPDGVTPSGVVITNLGTVAANSATSFSFQVTVDSATLGALTNSATVTTSTTDTNAANDATQVVTTVTGEADLGIRKSDSPDPVIAGTLLTYSITVTNAGPSDAESVEVSDTLPDGVAPTGVVIADLGTVAANSATTLSFQVTVDSATLGALTNAATVTTSTTDTNAANDATQVVTTVTGEADLGIVKSDSPDPVIAGTLLTYSITVTNAGPSDAESVQVSDTLPDGVTPTGVVIADLGTVAANSTTSFSFQVTVDSDALGALTNAATVTTSTTDTNAANDATQVVTTVTGEADLGIDKSDSPDPVIAGTLLTYSITVTNAGPSDAESVQVSDTLPGGVTPSGVVISNLGTVAANSATSFSFQVTVDSDTLGTLTNSATVTTFTTDANAANDATQIVTTVNAEADLEILKGAVTNGIAGTTLTYSITVTNHGPSDATSAQVTDTLPSGVRPTGVVIANLGTVSSGMATSFMFQVSIDKDTLGDITNTAFVTSSATDTNASNDADDAVTTVSSEADLSVIKTASTNRVIAGLPLTWTVTVSNAGPSVARNAVAVDTLPPEVSPTGSRTNDLGALAVGAVTSVTYDVTVDLFATGTAVNVVTVSTDADDPAADNDVATNAVEIIPRTTWVDRDGSGDLVITDIAAGGKADELLVVLDAGAGEIVISDTGALFVATIGTTDVSLTSARVMTGDVTGANAVIDTLEDDDRVTISFAGGAFALDFAVDGGADDDALELIGSPAADEFGIENLSVGVALDDITFTNVERVAVAGGTGDDRYLFQPDWGVKEILEDAAGGSDTMDFSNVSAGLIATVSSIEVTDGVNTALHAGAEIESLITGSGSDQVFVEAYGNALSIATGGNGDQVTVGSGGSLDGLAGDLAVDGGGSLDLLFVRDGADADVESVALSSGLIDRAPAARVLYSNFELLELDLRGDELSGTVGDGPGGLLLATLNLSGDTVLTGNLVVGQEATVLLASGAGFSGTGSLTNLGAVILATNEIEFGASLALADGGLLTTTTGRRSLTLAVGGDFTHASGNPNNDFIRGGITFTGTVAHALNVDAADQGPGLGGFTTGNRAIGVLDLQDDATVNGTVYIWEIRGDGDLTIPAGSRVYYGTTADWTGSVVGTGDFVPIVFGFTAFDSAAGTDTLVWESMPGFTSEIAILSDLLTGTPQVITGFVGTATTESLATPSDITNRTYQLRLRP